ncbi:GTPase [Helicobacter pylori]|uniref:GTPase n=1 Tax=Helicobacter pylori TaxID=210 RepID=A0A1A9HFS6_HELPX|nr:dynamin-like GTPase family protein [Helicobacter pylori]ANH48435.1 GTPase [Helicobacter pylori]
MNEQELTKKSALIEKAITEYGLTERARPFISENAVITTEVLEQTLKDMRPKDRNLKVGIIGRVKAGKSSLLNALIFEGKEVLPKAATPMTASLTVLKYAEKLSAEVELYNEKDIAELKNEHERYEKEFKRIVEEEVNKQKEKQSFSNRAKEGLKNFGNKFGRNKSEDAPKERVLSDEEILAKAERIAKNAFKENDKLVSSHDQYEKIKNSGVNLKSIDTRIQADNLGELNQKLLQFVGTNGKYMPYTKAVQIYLNNPNLKDLEVIDTPGVNDPIVSREERTKALLKDCDVVFIISPSSQFLTDSDMSLFDRVSNKEGLQEIYFVASQIDSALNNFSEVEKSNHHLPTALANAQKVLSSQLDQIMEALIKAYPNQQEIFEKAKKNGVIVTSGVCFSMHKDFENQAFWEKEKEEYHNALRNLKGDYPDAFNSDEKSKESLLLVSNMGAIKERLEKAAQEKEKIISQRLQGIVESQANNLHKLITQLLEDLEGEKKRIESTDMGTIKKQIEAYEKLSGEIETSFKEAYEVFIHEFIKKIRDDLEATLEKFIQNTEKNNEHQKGKDDEYFIKKVKQDGFVRNIARFFGQAFNDEWGYDKKGSWRKVTAIKAGAVVDHLIKMHADCEKALNDSAHSFKIVFRKELYAKVLSRMIEIIHDNSLIDKYAFKKSVMAVLDRIEFKEFHYTDKLPSEMRGITGHLKGDEADAFIKSVDIHVRDFKAETRGDVKNYTNDLRTNLEKQNFASDTLQKLQENTQTLLVQVQNKEQSIAQLETQIKALKGIQ